jgi:ferredoxin
MCRKPPINLPVSGSAFMGRLETTAMRVEVDDLKCVGAGQCVSAAPDVFDQREEDGVVMLLDDSPADELADAVQIAVSTCPAAAIRLAGR